MGKPAGKDWVNKFPTSNSVSDLKGSFASGVKDFIKAMKDAGAHVTISATLRPPERAYLMHWSYEISHGTDPSKVPAMKGVDIDWVIKDKAGKPDLKASKKAADDMVKAYDIVHEPVLKSRHTEGLAIDMDISWSGELKLKNAKGEDVTIATSPRDGGNKELQAVGETFGVYKLKSDPPHWSSDGH